MEQRELRYPYMLIHKFNGDNYIYQVNDLHSEVRVKLTVHALESGESDKFTRMSVRDVLAGELFTELNELVASYSIETGTIARASSERDARLPRAEKC